MYLNCMPLGLIPLVWQSEGSQLNGLKSIGDMEVQHHLEFKAIICRSASMCLPPDLQLHLQLPWAVRRANVGRWFVYMLLPCNVSPGESRCFILCTPFVSAQVTMSLATTVGVRHVALEEITELSDGEARDDGEDCLREETHKDHPSPFRVHGALILAQVIFGAASVVGKLGVERFNPLLFALLREGVSGPVLLVMALCHDGCLLPGDWKLTAALGLCVFSGQAFAILGIKLAGPVIGSAWQCSQPIFTLTISLALGWEPPTWRKVSGILLSFFSGAFLVVYGHQTGDAGAIGNIFLALNCLGTSLYVIFAKVALRRYPTLTVTAWGMMAASLMMAVLTGSLNNNCAVLSFVCPPEGNEHDFTCGSWKASCLPWHVPGSALLPLTYFILGNSIGSYLLITWANSYARPGYVLAYTALQPFTSTVLSVLLIVGWEVEGLEMPGWNGLGCVGILMALVLLLLDGKRQHEVDEATTCRPRKKRETLNGFGCGSKPMVPCWGGGRGF